MKRILSLGILLLLPLHAIEWQTLKSTVYPGTIRHYAFHKTPKLDPKKPAALMVFQDGHGYAAGDFHAPKVIDKLVSDGVLPPMLLVFVNPGVFADELKGPPAGTHKRNTKAIARSSMIRSRRSARRC